MASSSAPGTLLLSNMAQLWALLAAHPEGLSSADVRQALAWEEATLCRARQGLEFMLGDQLLDVDGRLMLDSSSPRLISLEAQEILALREALRHLPAGSMHRVALIRLGQRMGLTFESF